MVRRPNGHDDHDDHHFRGERSAAFGSIESTAPPGPGLGPRSGPAPGAPPRRWYRKTWVFIVAGLLAVGIAIAVGWGGSSGWSNADKERFRKDFDYDSKRDTLRRAEDCKLRVAENRFDNYTEYRRIIGDKPPGTIGEAAKAWYQEIQSKCAVYR